MKEILDQMRTVFGLMASDEFVESVATFTWKLYKRLKEKGFTDEQAIQIVCAMGKQNK